MAQQAKARPRRRAAGGRELASRRSAPPDPQQRGVACALAVFAGERERQPIASAAAGRTVTGRLEAVLASMLSAAVTLQATCWPASSPEGTNTLLVAPSIAPTPASDH